MPKESTPLASQHDRLSQVESVIRQKETALPDAERLLHPIKFSHRDAAGQQQPCRPLARPVSTPSVCSLHRGNRQLDWRPPNWHQRRKRVAVALRIWWRRALPTSTNSSSGRTMPLWGRTATFTLRLARRQTAQGIRGPSLVPRGNRLLVLPWPRPGRDDISPAMSASQKFH